MEGGRSLEVLLVLTLAVLAFLHLALVFRVNINWDEFRFLSDVYRSQAGTLSSPVQTFHVHLFGWLPEFGAHEVDQILAARVVYFGLLLGSCGFSFLIARRFLSTAASLFVVICYLSYSEILAHATAFRFDGLAVFFILGALALLLRPRLRATHMIVSGGLVAVALLVTVKSVFYAPTFLFVLLLCAGPRADSTPTAHGGRDRPLRDRPLRWMRAARDLGVFALAFSLVLVILYVWHRSGMAAQGETLAAAEVLQGAGPRFIRFDQLFPARQYLLFTVLMNAVIWGLLILGLVALALRSLRRRKDGEPDRDDLLLLALVLPLASLVVYRNAFPYYYAFIMPPAFVLCGIHFDQLLRKTQAAQGRGYRPIVAFWVVAVLGSFAVHFARYSPEDIAVQRQVVEAVHQIFPEPVAYIDRGSMIASFPKVGFFMSTLGFGPYHDAGQPIFEDLLREEAPRLLLANHPALVLDAEITVPWAPGPNRLLEEDLRVLRDNFLPYWGPIWVPGKAIRLPEAEPVMMEILIPGEYVIESDGAVWLGDVRVEPGNTASLATGRIRVASTSTSQEVVLKMDQRRGPPEGAAPTGVLFRDFHE